MSALYVQIGSSIYIKCKKCRWISVYISHNTLITQTLLITNFSLCFSRFINLHNDLTYSSQHDIFIEDYVIRCASNKIRRWTCTYRCNENDLFENKKKTAWYMFILVLVYTLNVNSVHGYILSNQLLSISVFVWRKTFSYRVELWCS